MENGSVAYSLQVTQPAHIRSRDAMLALQSPAAGGADEPTPVGRVSWQQDRGSRDQLQEQAETQHSQSAPASVQGALSLQRPRQALFPENPSDSEDSDQEHGLHPRPFGHSMHMQHQDCLSDIGESESSQTSYPMRAPPPQRPSRSVHMQAQASSGPDVDMGTSGSHMSPFAGFAALTMARTSMDDRGDHRSHAMRSNNHRASLEQAVGKDKIIRTAPAHIRRSLDASAGRKSLESQAPPPASSSGMRNSRDGVFAQTAEQASSRWNKQRKRGSLEASEQQHQERMPEAARASSTIKEVPSTPSSTDADADAPGAVGKPESLNTSIDAVLAGGQHQPEKFASGLSKFSPFASSGLLCTPFTD